MAPSTTVKVFVKVFVTPGAPLVESSGSFEGLSRWSPLASTLIYDASTSIVVDVPFIASQAYALADWVKAQTPDGDLGAIYITHGHGDHWLGLSPMLKRFPKAQVFAVPSVLEHMRSQLADLSSSYGLAFKGQLEVEDGILEKVIPLGPSERTVLLDGQPDLLFVETGQSDCEHSSYVHIPSLKTVVAGDIVYNEVHQNLVRVKTKQQRDAWIKTVEEIQALKPEIVIAGHKKEETSDGPECCHETIRYLKRFDRLAEMSAGWEDFFDEMLLEYPDRENRDILRMSAKAQF